MRPNRRSAAGSRGCATEADQVRAFWRDLGLPGLFDLHVQVGAFHLDDPPLDPVWGLLAEAGTPTVVYAGSGPVGNEFTPEYAQFPALAETYERVMLDTTMVVCWENGVRLFGQAPGQAGK